jgi:hypothetical protein
MTFCNDATSIAPFLHVHDNYVKQLVQILVHGNGLRNTEESLVTAVQEILLSHGSSFSFTRSSIYTDSGPFKTDFSLR